MNSTQPPLPETWLSRSGGADASGWLTAFQSDSENAVSELLWNRFYFGPLNLTERGQLLATWLDVLGDSEEFAQRLDSAFVTWIEENWGRFEHSTASRVSAWICLAGVIEFSAKLPHASRLANAAGALRARFPMRERFLGSFSTAPAADPLGFYLAAIAEFQGDDRSLAGFWQRLCDLPDGVPFYHARYAILGLRRLRALDDSENGTLRAEVVLGLLRLAMAFDRLVRERGLTVKVAKANFRRVAAQLAAAYPGSPGWSKHGLAPALELAARPQEWVMEAIPPLGSAIRQEKAMANLPHARPRPSIQANPNWFDRAQEIAMALRAGRIASVPDAERLLDEERRHATVTGDTYDIVRSLCNFAARIRRTDLDTARRWAEEARSWEPNNPFTWTAIKDVLLNQHDVRGALRFAWVAWKRFPENVVVRTGLAEVLKATERYTEAEEVYRQTGERFPDNTHVRNGLADVLKAARRYAEAEEVYRQTIERFPDDVVARNGLADTLRRAHRWPEAEVVYRDSIAAGYVSVATFVGLAYLVLRTRGETGRAEALDLSGKARQLDRLNPYARSLQDALQPGPATNLAAIVQAWESAADRLHAVAVVHDQDEEHDADVGEAEYGKARSDAAPSKPAQQSTGSAPQEDSGQRPDAPPTAGGPPPVDLLQVTALVAEAYFYRTWAERSPSGEATARRQAAAVLLARAGEILPDDAQVAAEKAAVESSLGNQEQAKKLISQLGDCPGSAPLLALKARLDREAARREQRRMSEASLAELLQGPSRLRDLDPALILVFHMQHGLAALSLLDGNVRTETAAKAFSSFRRTVARRAAEESRDRAADRDKRARLAPRFHEWLQSTTNRRLFGAVADPETVRPDEVVGIAQLWTGAPLVFDEIEDVIVDRIAFAGV